MPPEKRAVLTKQIFYSPQRKLYQPNNWENCVYHWFPRALHKAHPEVPEVSPHELRHTRATLWIAQGMDLYMAARLLGHRDLKMLTLRSHQHGNAAEGASKRAESLRSLNGYADDLLRNRRRICYFMSCSRASICLNSSKYF